MATIELDSISDQTRAELGYICGYLEGIKAPETIIAFLRRLAQTKCSSTLTINAPAVERVKTEKAITTVFTPYFAAEVWYSLPASTINRFKHLYPDAKWMEREFVKAFGWYEMNSAKKPRTIRGWAMAMSSWLERAWRDHAKRMPTVTNTVDWKEVFGEGGTET